jgi:hypothetical protein
MRSPSFSKCRSSFKTNRPARHRFGVHADIARLIHIRRWQRLQRDRILVSRVLAYEDAYRGRDDVPPAVLALVVALRERVEHITAGKPLLDEPEPNAATVTQDEP